MKIETTVKSALSTGAAWSSSACSVSCSVKSGNMRNPYPMLNFFMGDCPALSFSKYFWKLKCGEKGGDDVRSAWPSDVLGHTRATMGRNSGSRNRKVEPIP